METRSMEVIKMYEYQSRESGDIFDHVASVMTDGNAYNLKCGKAIIDIQNIEAGEKLLNQLFINVKEVPSIMSELSSFLNLNKLLYRPIKPVSH